MVYVQFLVTLAAVLAAAAPPDAQEFAEKGYRVWIPDTGGKPVRGVFVHRTYGGGDTLYGRKTWRQLATRIAFGHVVMPQSGKLPVSPSQGRKDLDRLDAFLAKASTRLNRSELARAPFIALGISRAGANAIVMGYAAPDRAIAAMGYHGISGVGVHSMGGKNRFMPVYYPMASLDPPSKGRNRAIEPYIRQTVRRSSGLPWTIKVDRNARHASQPDDALAFAWIEDVVASRLGKNGVLRPVPLRGSWGASYAPVHLDGPGVDLVDVKIAPLREWKSSECWLPSKRCAELFLKQHPARKK